VFNVLPGFGPGCGEAMALHMDIDGLVFTGSTAVGKHLLQCSGRSNMKRAYMECGGKSPNIVFADAPDLKAAATAAAGAIFYNQGEVCTAAHACWWNAASRTNSWRWCWRPARPCSPGIRSSPMRRWAPWSIACRWNACSATSPTDARKEPSLAMGGKQVMVDSGGFYIEPTVFDDVAPGMRISREEIFGPVLSAIAFDTEEEAVRIANDSIYGLAAALWTQNLSRAHRVARKLRAGSVWVNYWDGGDMTAPFGGYKQSGNGRDKSLQAFSKYTETKATWINLG
jgi:gamma-glutamyl-gamma-aminobutyraldehyde dehydrogenase